MMVTDGVLNDIGSIVVLKSPRCVLARSCTRDSMHMGCSDFVFADVSAVSPQKMCISIIQTLISIRGQIIPQRLN